MSVLFKYLVSQGWTFGAVSDASWYAYPWQSECPGLVRSTAYQEAAAHGSSVWFPDTRMGNPDWHSAPGISVPSLSYCGHLVSEAVIRRSILKIIFSWSRHLTSELYLQYKWKRMPVLCFLNPVTDLGWGMYICYSCGE